VVLWPADGCSVVVLNLDVQEEACVISVPFSITVIVRLYSTYLTYACRSLAAIHTDLSSLSHLSVLKSAVHISFSISLFHVFFGLPLSLCSCGVHRECL